MPMTGKDWVDLFKFPLTIFVALVTLVIAGLILGIKPSSFKYGELSVEFEKDLKKEILLTNLNLQEAFREETATEAAIVDSTENLEEEPPPPDLIAERRQNTVSDNVAQFSIVETEQGPESIFKHVTGYIYIGSFNKEINEYTNLKIEIPHGDMRLIRPGEVFLVNDNLVIRQHSPVENVNYFKGEKKVGLASRGSEVRILSRPEARDFGDYKEFWVKVELLN